MTGLGAAYAAAATGPSAVELNAFDGSAKVKGELLEVSHGSYVVKTALGTLRIGIDEAECVGEACPRLDRFDADFGIASSSAALKSAMSSLLSRYAASLDAGFSVIGEEEEPNDVAIVDNENNERLANIRLGLIEADEQAQANSLSVFAEPFGSIIETRDDLLTIGLDGVALIVHPDSPLFALSRDEIAQVFACGEGGVQTARGFDGPIKLYARATSSDTFRTFKATVLDPFGIGLCDEVTQLPSDADVASAVARDVNAIGFVSLGYAHDVRPLTIAECGLAHEPSLFAAKAGEYPLTRRILLDAPSLDESSGAAQRFIDFALSEDGQEQLQEVGLIGLNLATTSAYASRYRLARIEAAVDSTQNAQLLTQLLNSINDAVRLSATFRFLSGAGNVLEENGLNNRALRDLSRLVLFLKSRAPGRTEVLVFGFADATGDYDANLALSRQRAQSVADKLASLGVNVSMVGGFGEEAPIACNDDPSGRAKNRRVEVWLRLLDKPQAPEITRITM